MKFNKRATIWRKVEYEKSPRVTSSKVARSIAKIYPEQGTMNMDDLFS